MSNAEQIENWDGPGGQHWAAEAERYDRMSHGFADQIVARLDPNTGEQILDVGCGNGALTVAVAPLITPNGSVTGLDISSPMLDTARQRADHLGLANVTFEHGDAQVHRFLAGGFDALISRFGVMFFDDPAAAFTNLAQSLRPGGRVVFTCWRELAAQDWIMIPAAAALEHVPMPDLGEPGSPGPFSLADPEDLRLLLTRAGLTDIDLEPLVTRLIMGSSLDDALDFMQTSEMADALFADTPDEATARAWATIRRTLEPHVTAEGVALDGAAWLVSAWRGS